MLFNPVGLDKAAIIDPNIRRAWTQLVGPVTFTDTTNHGTLFKDNVKCLFGDASDAQIWYNGTDLIIDPKAVGSGNLRVGAATTDQCNFYAYRMGLGDTVPSGGALLQATTTSATIVGVFSATLRHTGATATMRTMLFTAVHQGTSTTNVTAIGAVFTGNIDTDTATGTRQSIGVQASGGFASGRVQTQGTFDYSALIAKAPTTGGTHTGGNIRARNLLIEAESTFTVSGATVQVSVAAQCQGTFHLLPDKKFIVDGTATAPGTSYFIYNTGTTDWEFFDAGTSAFKIDATTNTSMVDFTMADAKNFILNTSNGTKFGTGTTQKMGFYNATPIAQRSGAAQAAVATTAATNVAPFGYTTAAQADAIVTLVNELRAWAVAQGFIKGSA